MSGHEQHIDYRSVVTRVEAIPPKRIGGKPTYAVRIESINQFGDPMSIEFETAERPEVDARSFVQVSIYEPGPAS